MAENIAKVDYLTPEINKHIGYRLGQIRTRFAYSHAYVGDKIGRSGELVRQIENSITSASPGTIAAIAQVFNVDVAYFFEGFKFDGGMENQAKDERLKRINHYILQVNNEILNISTYSEIIIANDDSKVGLESEI